MTKQKQKSKKSMFFKAKYQKYSDIVSLKDIGEAQKSIKSLKQEFDGAKTQTKKIRVFRVAQAASNRAGASMNRKNLSKKERKEYRIIGNIYNKLANSLGVRLENKSPKYARMLYRERKR